ncbi:uncharacterized protein Z520_05562 [Fonsecaea multimorphosa CBS 102226]|uniref:Uncharacterized protein n=1 Tax=Fonsecaea multimorphosa CBS 102226 TaxID=1442371 RepID=A0A0D2IQ67_9EURO|nr:uncharacterized protein Z520_05562 [Fonsecaea multimorphosa CBS 102226]KIX99101.1 hypothetical protein Z520_05562 [Fonsecaea multimorphosa CBS 102226]OAL25363.1 hypothetical protein AYO22_05240 [Fonsecaea multimorphosa]
MAVTSQSWTENIIIASSTSQLLRPEFPFDARLRNPGVTQGEWGLFTTELVHCMRLARASRHSALGSGILVGATLSAIGGPLGPLMGVCTWRFARRALEQENVLQNTLLARVLDSTLEHWNSELFLSHGLIVRLEFPDGRRATQERDDDEYPEYFARQKSSSRSESRKVTKEYGRNLYWVSGLDKPRLVLTHLDAGCDHQEPPPVL